MTRDTWPHIRVWVTETPTGLELSFTQGSPLPQHTVHPGRWPKLPSIAHRDPEGRITELVLGAPKHAESPGSGIEGAGVVPYPHDLDVIRALDLLVEVAICQLIGDDYPAAIRALNAAARAAAPPELPRDGPARPDWWTGGPHNWSAEQRERIPGCPHPRIPDPPPGRCGRRLNTIATSVDADYLASHAWQGRSPAFAEQVMLEGSVTAGTLSCSASGRTLTTNRPARGPQRENPWGRTPASPPTGQAIGRSAPG